MAELAIEKKYVDISPKDLDKITTLTARYIADWTQREFQKLTRHNKIPLCWPLKNGGLVIGNFTLTPLELDWVVKDPTSRERARFRVKQAAIFYCLCHQIGQGALAEDLRIGDNSVSKFTDDTVYYHRSLKRAQRDKNYPGIDVWQARQDDAALRLKAAQTQLRKSIDTAKYLKLWSN